MILGHARISATMQIHAQAGQEARDDARTRLNNLPGGGQ
jgi:hypothetical protein